MEIKNYLFKNIYNNQKEYIAKKIIKRNKRDAHAKDSIFNKKPESTTSLFKHKKAQKNSINLKNNKTNSLNNITINKSSNFNSNCQSQNIDKNHFTKKTCLTLNSYSRNFSQANQISLNNKKNILTTASNTTTTSLINNQINYNKCITDRNLEDTKNKNINNIKNFCNGSQIISKNKNIHNNKDLKEISANIAPKKTLGIGIKKINNNIAKYILKNKMQNKENKYQLNNIDNINENNLFKRKIKNTKNSNSKLNTNYNKLKNHNANNNLNENKNKLNNNILTIKKLNFSNMPMNLLEGKIIQGIFNINNNNNIESSTKKEFNTEKTNCNNINNINSQMKGKAIINEQYNNINNNYIIANIINNIKLNNKKVKEKKTRNKSNKLIENNKKNYNSNLISLNLLVNKTRMNNYPSSLRIKTINLSKINNSKSPTIDYNTSFNKNKFFEKKNLNKKLFDRMTNINSNKKKVSSKKKKYCNLKHIKKGKNYKRLKNIPLKLTKKKAYQKEKKLNLEMNFSNKSVVFDKLNLLTFNYVHLVNPSHKTENSLFKNKRKNQGKYIDRYRNIFQLFYNNKGSISENKRDSNINNNKTYNISNILKTNIIHNIPKKSKILSKYMNSLSNYEMNSKEKEEKKNNKNNIKENLHQSNLNIKTNNNKLNNNKKLLNKKIHYNSLFDINCLLKKGKSRKKNNKKDYFHSKSRNISRNYNKINFCFINNESKTSISKYRTKAKIDVNCPKKRRKAFSEAIFNEYTSSTINIDNINQEKNNQKYFSPNSNFNAEKSNIINSKTENNNELKLISTKSNNSGNSLNKNIQNINSVISIKEKSKNINKSEFSKISKNIIPLNIQEAKTVIDDDLIEKGKERNPYIMEEYFDEILYSLLKEESEFKSKNLINENYLLEEDYEITPEMRAMVIDWLIEVHQIFHFKEKCLYTTIQIIDKYLSKIKIKVEEFQLLALTALNIASKEEEIEYPILDNFITISKNSLTKNEMIYMENKILSELDYEIISPTVVDFFQIFAAICNLNQVEISQGLYIMNIILIDINMLKYKNSILAFAVLHIITKENKIKDLFLFLEEINKKAFEINRNKNNFAKILIDEINKEFQSNEIEDEIRQLFKIILKTNYHNAKTKFNNQNFYAVSSYTSL